MASKGIDYQEYKERYRLKHPEEFRSAILASKIDLDIRFIKPAKLIEYE